MKRRLQVVSLLIILVLSSFLVMACKKENKTSEYFSLSLQQSIGGTLTASLEVGSVKDGKYLSGSKIKLAASEDTSGSNVYKFEKMTVGDKTVTDSSYTFIITANMSAKAFFKNVPQAAIALSRIEKAFASTYPLDGYGDADGIAGTITHNIVDQDNNAIKLINEFSFAKSGLGTYFGIRAELASIPLFGIYYIDSDVSGEAQFAVDMLGSVFFVKLETIADVMGLLESEIPTDPSETGGDSSSELDEYLNIELLEMLGVIYDIRNTEYQTTFSVNATMLIELFVQLAGSLEELDESGLEYLESLPQIEIIVKVDFKEVAGEEQIKDISYEIVIEPLDEEDDKIELTSKVKIELDTWTESAPAPAIDLEYATETTFEELIDLILMFLAFGNL